jgi:hypothetical protein
MRRKIGALLVAFMAIGCEVQSDYKATATPEADTAEGEMMGAEVAAIEPVAEGEMMGAEVEAGEFVTEDEVMSVEPVDEGEMTGAEVEVVEPAAGEKKRPPPRENCQAHYRGCLASDIGDEPGGQPGHSRCWDCHDSCRANGEWPDKTPYGADCRWWMYEQR